MNKIYKIMLCTVVTFSCVQTGYGFYRQRAEEIYAEREEAKIRAIENQLMRDDIELFFKFFKGIGYFLKATGKVMFLVPTEDNFEKFIGICGAAGICAATAAIIYNKFFIQPEKAPNSPCEAFDIRIIG